MVKVSDKKHSDAIEDIPDAWTDSRGRGENKRTPKRPKRPKKRNCRPKIKQKGWQRWQMSYGNESQSNGRHT